MVKDLIGAITTVILFSTGKSILIINNIKIQFSEDPVTWTLQNLAFLATVTVCIYTIYRNRKNGQKAVKKTN